MIYFEKNTSLRDYTTFASDAKAVNFVEISSLDDIYNLIDAGVLFNDYYFLGKGANTLFKQDYSGVVIKNTILGKELLSGTEDTIMIRVGAGEDWEKFVLWTITQGYLGLENLIDIPGSVGASPIQNIGAYGVEVADCIVSVEGIYIDNNDKKLHNLHLEDCKFAYRDSIFKHDLKKKFLITHVVFKLQKQSDDYIFNLSYQGIRDVMKVQNISKSEITQAKLAEIISTIRASKLPDYKKLGTAGSFFKNPIVSKEQYIFLKQRYPNLISFPVKDSDTLKLSAGQLIDISGFKNYRIGSVGTYEKHELVLVNYGGASGAEIWQFAQMIQKKVQKKFSVLLEVEVNIV